ncbi:MAG: Ig-like domain-containing protein [Anaerolineae bacterium]
MSTLLRIPFRTLAWVVGLSLTLIVLLGVFTAGPTGRTVASLVPGEGQPVSPSHTQDTIIIPQDDNSVTLDGVCDVSAEYSKALAFQFTDATISGTVYLKQEATHLFVCMEGVLGTDPRRFTSVYLDTDNGREKWAEGDDYSLRVDIITGTESSWVGTGVANGYTATTLADWTAVTARGDYDVAEYKIPVTLTGGICNAPFGIAVYHHWIDYTGDDYGWPSQEWFDQPQTWQMAEFKVAPCPSADLAVYKYDDPDPVMAGGYLTYTIVVENAAGPDAAIGIVLTDTLPAGVIFVPDMSDERCTEASGTVTCNLGDLDPGWNTTVYIVVILPGGGGTITNTATVTAKSADGEPGNNTATADTTVNESPVPFPDLTITDIWLPDDGLLHYQIRNIGAQAPAGHETYVWVDGNLFTKDPFVEPLGSFEAVERVLSHVWTCSPPSDTIQVCADGGDIVTEGKEGNNCRTETWRCDAVPPQITDGPETQAITANSAQVCWTTDELSNGRVRYGRKTGVYDAQVFQADIKFEHCVTLTGLTPATAYNYVVESADGSENTTRSREIVFRTLPAPDSESPTVTLNVAAILSGTVQVTANASDNRGVDRVIFLVDGQPWYTDFSSPYTFNLNSRELPDGTHTISARAMDAAGNQREATENRNVQNIFPRDLSPIHVNILSPAAGSEVAGMVPVMVEVTHDLRSPIRQLEFYVDNVLRHTANDYTCRRSGLVYRCQGDPPMRDTWTWDATALADGSQHRIEVRAYDSVSPPSFSDAAVTVTVRRPQAQLAVSQQVEWRGNYAHIILRLENSGNVPVTNPSFTHESRGFQVVGECQTAPGADAPFGPVYIVPVGGLRDGRTSSLTNSYSGALAPGGVVRFAFDVVPALQHPEDAPHVIGERIELRYIYNTRAYTQTVTNAAYASSALFDTALRQADYLIVTNPSRLFVVFPSGYQADAHTYRVLATMAELARQSQGVLGYLPMGEPSVTPEELKGLLRGAGSWGDRLRPGWTNDGYLLLVGETEIVPAKTVPSGFSSPRQIHDSDNWYADLDGNDKRPELRVGRIVGDDVLALRWAMRASLDVAQGRRPFDRANIMLVSGSEGQWEMFVRDSNRVAALLSAQGARTESVHYDYYDTSYNLRRSALAILGSAWECMPTPQPLPPQIAHLRSLTCRWDFYDEPAGRPQPPTDKATLEALISIPDAELVEALRRGLFPVTTYRLFDDPNKTNQENEADASAAQLRDVQMLLPGKSVYLWNGHGSEGRMREFVGADFGLYHPVIFSNSCETGYYSGLYGGPESAFTGGAAVFIGATEVVWLGDERAARLNRVFFNDYWTRTATTGTALRALKREQIAAFMIPPGISRNQDPRAYREWMSLLKDWRYTADEYNLYGDPKYGAVTTMVAGEAQGETIPTADLLAGPPPATLEVNVPALEVSQAGGMEQVEIPGGNYLFAYGQPLIPIYHARVAVAAGYQVQDVRLLTRAAPTEMHGLYLPLYMPMATEQYTPPDAGRPMTEVEGPYPNRAFDWTVSRNADGSSELVVTVYAFVYHAATGDALFYPSYTFAVDAIASPVTVAALATDKTVYGLGEAVRADIVISNTGAAQDVLLSATLRETSAVTPCDGLPLRMLSELSGLVSLSEEVSGGALPAGEYVLDVELYDTAGRILATGSAEFRVGVIRAEATALTATPQRFQLGDPIALRLDVRNSGEVPLSGLAIVTVHGADGVAQEFRHNITNLSPAAQLSFNDTWPTAGVAPGAYTVTGYVLYDSQASAVRSVVLQSESAIYLPLVLRSVP